MIKKVVGLYYSPAGGTARMTARLAQEVASRLNEDCPEEISVECRNIKHADVSDLGGETLVIIGVPTYVGKAPVSAVRALRKLDGCDATTLTLVSYSGRSYGNALYEISHYAEQRCFEVIGAGAIAISFRGRRGKNAGEHAIMDTDALLDYAKVASAKIKRLGGCDIDGLRVKAAPLEVDGRLPIHRISRVVPGAAALAQGVLDSIPLGRKESEWFL